VLSASKRFYGPGIGRELDLPALAEGVAIRGQLVLREAGDEVQAHVARSMRR
jgi:hypothetical protein